MASGRKFFAPRVEGSSGPRLYGLLAVGGIALLLLYGFHTTREHNHGAIALETIPAIQDDGNVPPDTVHEPPDLQASQLEADRPIDAAVWWFAPFLDHSSFGAEASGYVLSLLRQGLVAGGRLHIGLLQNDCGDQLSGLMEEQDHSQLLALHGSPSEAAIVVCHNLPPYLGRPSPRWASCEPCPPPTAGGLVRYAVARVMAETSRIPTDFVRSINSLDEVWVPTEASEEVLRRSGVTRPTVVVPLGVDTQELDRRRVLPLPLPPQSAVQVFGPPGRHSPDRQRPFAFVSIFKWELRKGYDVLLKAFLQEFGPAQGQQDPQRQQQRQQSDPGRGAAAAGGSAAAAAPCDGSDVELYILTKPFLSDETGAGLQARMRQWAGDALGPQFDPDRGPRVFVVSGHVPRRDYVAMLAAADAFVLPTRGEGWGLPILEAMSLGLPVIATNWSGPTAYMDEQVGYPLSYSLEAVPPTEPYWFQGSQWAEPSVPHLRDLMRAVASCAGRADARARGRAARRRAVERYAHPVVARRVAAELRRIASATRPGGGA
ncbi:hypothetical protein PLESTF_001373600 [Pleodorina starrii]|nr:hypothetical protein PLESTF_001373600 [Pleodorina starrii]